MSRTDTPPATFGVGQLTTRLGLIPDMDRTRGNPDVLAAAAGIDWAAFRAAQPGARSALAALPTATATQ